MEWTGLNELRESFLSFFESKGHLRLESFPLVPNGDKSLLLINSGMAPMKKWFLKQEEPPRHRVTTSQKCIRTPDIERVGITARHGTFFEMLGNFSFQDYFKPEAITWAWEYLTVVLKIPADKLYISVYTDDDEAYDFWTKNIGIAEDHMVRFGKEDNFWEHGPGPCGPCSEIYFDRGPEYGCGKPTCGVGCDCDRYMEIWNLVFSQFDSDGKGTYTRLAQPNIDTGMGLERLACVMQGVGNLFEVDTVHNILEQVEQISGKKYGADAKTDISIRVITDHIRSCVFMTSDGILPSNVGRGYVLRRLLRRAARHGRLIGIDRPFLAELCDTVIADSAVAYPELAKHAGYIKKIIGAEEERFSRTIDQGLEILNGMLDTVKNKAAAGGEAVLPGSEAFRLQDTFGFPIDLTREIAAEAGIRTDDEGYKKELDRQRDTARRDRQQKEISGWTEDLFGAIDAEPTCFVGYETLSCESTVVALSDGTELPDEIATDEGAKDGVLLVLDRTPFYAESGGQVADTGRLTAEGVELTVHGCRKTPKGYYVHVCTLEKGLLTKGLRLQAEVDRRQRMAIARDHTSAHLLQAALRQVLGEHVHQAGSYEDASRMRFDFTHFAPMTADQIRQVEQIVNDRIGESLPVVTRVMPLAEAQKLGAMALFGEKYGDRVRVVSIGDFSLEFCGGTHVSNIAEIGGFRILSEASAAAGIRRIEAVTGTNLLQLFDERTAMLGDLAAKLKAGSPADLPARADALLAEVRDLRGQIEKNKAAEAGSRTEELYGSGRDVDGLKVFTASYREIEPDSLREICGQVRDRIPESVTVLIGEFGGKTSLAVSAGTAAIARGVKAGNLAKAASAVAGGKGGGKPDLAMAGIPDASGAAQVLAAVPDLVHGML